MLCSCNGFLVMYYNGFLVMLGVAGDLSLWMAPAYNFETIFNFSAHELTSMSFSHNQWWLLMGDADGTLRYLHSYDEIMKGKGAVCVSLAILPRGHWRFCSAFACCEGRVLLPHRRQVRDVQRRQRAESV